MGSEEAAAGAPLRYVTANVRSFGHIDVLVNNAGIIRRNDALEFTEADWDEVLDVNLKSVFFLSAAAARAMLERGAGGKIINIASMLSFQGGVRVASYTASKSGVAPGDASALARAVNALPRVRLRGLMAMLLLALVVLLANGWLRRWIQAQNGSPAKDLAPDPPSKGS